MAETVLASLEQLQKIAAKNKEISDNLTGRLETIEKVGPQANVLEGVKVNGKALAIVQKMVDILVTTGTADGTIQVNGVDVSVKGLAQMAYRAQVSQGNLDQALIAILNEKAVKSTTLSGYGIGDAYTKEEINAKISAVYKPAGSLIFANLPALDESILGNVYNVTDAFTTNASFVEGAGSNYPKGTNVVCIKMENTYKWDVLAGFVDISGKVDKETGKGLSTHDFTNTYKTKLDGIAEGANKYVHPTYTVRASGLYKITVDASGHVSNAVAVTKADITALGIPAQDTTYPLASSTQDGRMSKADKAKLDSIDLANVRMATDEEVAALIKEVYGG